MLSLIFIFKQLYRTCVSVCRCVTAVTVTLLSRCITAEEMIIVKCSLSKDPIYYERYLLTSRHCQLLTGALNRPDTDN